MRSDWTGSRIPRILRHFSTAASRSLTRNEMWSSRISGMCSPFGPCGTRVLDLELAQPRGVARLERGELLGRRRRRLRRVLDCEGEAGRVDDVLDARAGMDALQQGPPGTETD